MIRKRLEEKIAAFPHHPGVYQFIDAEGVVLYVGKATSLKNRVRQYFSGQEEKSRGYRMKKLVESTVDVQIIETDSALEALLLESFLIKKLQPKYNVDGKDGKSWTYLIITKEQFPRIEMLRATDFIKAKYQTDVYKKGKVFGPYLAKKHLMIALKIIRPIFPYHDRPAKSEKGCLSYQIGMCPGPYDGAISEEAYKKNITHITMLLSGEKKRILASLEKDMKAYAKAEEFEEAEHVKRQVFALTHIRDVALLTDDAKMPSEAGVRLECYDISHISGEHMVASMVVFIDGESDPSAYRKFKVKAVEGINDVAAMREVLARRLNHLEDWGVPTVIVLDGGKGHLNMAEKLFQDLDVDTKIGLLAVAKGPTRKKVDVYESATYPVSRDIVEDKDTLESAREEAHRFAIIYHKKLRDGAKRKV